MMDLARGHTHHVNPASGQKQDNAHTDTPSDLDTGISHQTCHNTTCHQSTTNTSSASLIQQSPTSASRRRKATKRNFVSTTLAGMRALSGISVMSTFLILTLCCQTTSVSGQTLCPHECTCQYNLHLDSTPHPATPVTSMDCSTRGLKSLPRGVLTWEEFLHVDLTNTSTSNNQTHSSSTSPTLQLLDLSHNALTSAAWPELKANLSEHETSYITPADHRPESNTTSDVITSVNDVTRHWVISVLHVDMSHNLIASLSPRDLSVYRHLRVLDLSHNMLNDLDPDTFHDLQSLTSLDLSHNSLHHLHSSTLHGLVNLHTLDLSHNTLTHIDLHTVLGDLTSLTHLSIHHNQLTELSLPSLPRLSTLDLSHNNLTSLPAVPAALGLPSLRTLNLSDNNIQEVHTHTDSLHHLANLTQLSLAHNPQLDFLPTNLFTPLTRLTSVDLSFCGLTLLSEITFQNLPHLKRVSLSGNPFRCACANAWLTDPPKESFHDAQSIPCSKVNNSEEVITSPADLCREVRIHNMTQTIYQKLGSSMLLQVNNFC